MLVLYRAHSVFFCNSDATAWTDVGHTHSVCSALWTSIVIAAYTKELVGEFSSRERKNGARLVLVGCGSYKLAKSMAENFKFPISGPDPPVLMFVASPQVYESMGMMYGLARISCGRLCKGTFAAASRLGSTSVCCGLRYIRVCCHGFSDRGCTVGRHQQVLVHVLIWGPCSAGRCTHRQSERRMRVCGTCGSSM